MTSLKGHIEELIKAYGGLRPAARAVGVDPTYLHRLRNQDKQNPSDQVLSALGLRRVVVFERTDSIPLPAREKDESPMYVYQCKGCGRTAFATTIEDAKDLDHTQFVRCCPERCMVVVGQIPVKFAESITITRPLTCEDSDKFDGPCWLWQGRVNRNGYGRVNYKGKEPVVHRVTYEMVRGDIPDLHVLDHLCEVRNCCNPFHLEPVSVKENTKRGKAVLYKAAHQYAKKKGSI